MPVAAQTPPAAPPPPRVVLPGGAVPAQVIIQSGAQGVVDPQLASAMQQAGVDQSLVAQVEFDPPSVLVGERATYRVVVTAMIEGVSLPDKLPAPPGLDATFTAKAFSYGGQGGAIQPRTTLNYRVSAKAAGTYEMPSYSASANGKPITIPGARLTVLPPGSPRPAPSARLLLEAPAGEFFIGQPVLVRVVLLDPGDNSIVGLVQPQVSGGAFVAEPGPLRYRREMRNDGIRFVAAQICEILVTPVKEGELSLTAQGQAVLNRPPPAGGISLPNYYPLLDSEPVAVTVKHLPKDGELPGFTGAIGRFQIEAPKVSTNQVRAGEPVSLTVAVRGEGNLARLVPPRLVWAKSWQVFPPVVENASPMEIQLRGSISFTYTLIAVSDTAEATPAIPFSCYDPQKRQYVDLTIPPVPIKVLPAPGVVNSGAQLPQSPTGDSGPPAAERDLAMTGLAEAPGRIVSSLTPVQQRPWFLGLQLAPAAVLGGIWWWNRRRRYLAEHPEIVLKAQARRGLRRQLRLARRAAEARDAAGFVTAAVNAMREVCAPQAAANPEALVCADILTGLAPDEREGKEGQFVRRLFTAADELRFVGRSPDGTTLLALQPEVEELLRKWRERL